MGSRGKGATGAELREAERGFKLWLRRRFSAAWIAENARDLMGQANVEYAEWLRVNPPARNPVGWLMTCAERRAKNLLDTQTRRPKPVPLEAVFHVPDDATPTPEERALDRDRSERLQDALGFLPEKERMLLALVYFGDHSIREAGRKLGWQKSAADRHHNWALEKLRALVGDDRSVLNPATLGLAAWLATYGQRGAWRRAGDAILTPGREALAAGLDGGERIAERVAGLGRKLSPLGDPASAAASGGGGRLVGACGVAAASIICAVSVSAVAPSGRAALSPARPASVAGDHGMTQAFTPPPLPSPRSASGASSVTAGPPEKKAPSTHTSAAPRAKLDRAPRATVEQTIDEFGVEGGSAPAPEEVSAAPIRSRAPSSTRSASSGGSSAVSPTRAGNGSEFAQ